MNFFKDRYLATLASGYALMGLQILITLASVPLALSYLGTESFGVWSLAIQVSTWLLLLDGGMNGALARNLIDYHQDPNSEELHHCISTGFRILLGQGVLILLIALLAGYFSGPLFGLDQEQSRSFGQVMTILGTATCMGFSSKIVQSWYYAIQRLEVCNMISLGMMVIEFALLWWLLRSGHGLASLAWARLVSITLTSGILWWTGIRFAAFPAHFLTGSWNLPMFRELATFGGGMFLLTLGTQLLTMTQTAMVTKMLGLATAAVWATAPKLFQMALQMVSKLWDYRIPYLSTLMAKDERVSLIRDFSSLFRATAYIGGGGLGAIAAVNPMFLALWTHDTIQWEHVNDWLMAIILYAALLIRCLTDFVLHTKKVGWMPLLMMVEGLIFVGTAMWMLPRHGIPGMLVASLVAGGLLRLAYAWKQFRCYLRLETRDAIKLIRHTLGGLALGSSLYFLISLLGRLMKTYPDWFILSFQSAACFMLLGPIALKLVVRAQHSPKHP